MFPLAVIVIVLFMLFKGSKGRGGGLKFDRMTPAYPNLDRPTPVWKAGALAISLVP